MWKESNIASSTMEEGTHLEMEGRRIDLCPERAIDPISNRCILIVTGRSTNECLKEAAQAISMTCSQINSLTRFSSTKNSSRLDQTSDKPLRNNFT
jgi:hypothetical protein